ncbi:MAG: ATP-binding protein [Pseudomonadota bacterium]
MLGTDTLKHVIGAVPIPLLWIGQGERVLAANQSALDLFGPINPDRHYITVLRQPSVLDCIEEAFRTGIGQKTAFNNSKQGHDSRFEVQAEPAVLDGTSGVMVSFIDVTHVEETGQIRRDFVANVSHELRTPLTAMSSFIETLRGAARDDAAARERFLGIMSHEAERMNRLVQDLLSLSRVEAAERQRPTEVIDLSEVLHQAKVHVTRPAEDVNLTISVDVPETPAEVIGDHDQLIQVFVNLLENAIKYGSAGGRVEVRLAFVEYAAQLRSPAIRVDVVDFGEGVDPIHLPRLTERFYRVDDHRSRQMGGTGLGLAIVKHIVNRHRGRLKVESEPGQGSTFSVFLPLPSPQRLT